MRSIRPTMLVIVIFILPLAACAFLNSAETDTAPLFPGFEDPALRADRGVTTVPAAAESALPPPFRWMSSRNMEFYSRMAKTIVTGEPLDTSGFSPEEIDAAYSAIFPNPTSPQQHCYYGWFATFSDGVRWMSNERVRVFLVQLESDPLFTRYTEKKWETAYISIRVVKNLDDGSVKGFGVVIEASKPRAQ